jgi:hypothetical protein
MEVYMWWTLIALAHANPIPTPLVTASLTILEPAPAPTGALHQHPIDRVFLDAHPGGVDDPIDALSWGHMQPHTAGLQGPVTVVLDGMLLVDSWSTDGQHTRPTLRTPGSIQAGVHHHRTSW